MQAVFNEPKLIDEVNKSAYEGLSDWQVSHILNNPDENLPAIVEVESKLVGPGLLMETIGADAGAALLDTLEELAEFSPPIKWAMKLILNNGVDVSSKQFRKQLDGLVHAGKISAENATKIKGLAETIRYPSWAEYHQIEVTPRTVGLARGGK